MPRSSSPFLFEQLSGEIIFSYLTASLYEYIVLPKMDYHSRQFSSNSSETKVVFNCAKQLLMIDQHPSIRFEQLEADLFFRFSFNQTLRFDIPTILKNDLFIVGERKTPIYTENEKLIDIVLADDGNLTEIIFPNQSPATIDDQVQLRNDEQSAMVNQRYCIFESTLKVENLFEKLLQLERLLAFFTARHLFRLIKCHRQFSTKTLPFDFQRLIESIQSNNFERITDGNISTLTCMTLSCIGFAGFSMPMNLQSDIIKLLDNSNISQETQGQCRFYFLNAMLNNGRLLFHHVNDTQKGWRRAILTSVALLSERTLAIEILQKSIQVDVNAVLDRTDRQNRSIEKKMDMNTGKINRNMNNLEGKMSNLQEKMNNLEGKMNNLEGKMSNLEEKMSNLEEKMNNLQEKINMKIDKMEESTNEELKKIIKLITLNGRKSRACSCILL